MVPEIVIWPSLTENKENPLTRVPHQEAKNCDYAHGFWDMKRDLKSAELLALKMELFNIRQILNRSSQSVLFNPKSKRYEIYKNKDLNILRAIMRGESVQIAGGNVDEDDEEEDADENPATNN